MISKEYYQIFRPKFKNKNKKENGRMIGMLMETAMGSSVT
jgi:hypothetical protein